MDRPDGRRVLKFDGLSGRGLWIALTGNAYKVSVTDLPFCVIRYDRHSADWLAALASPLSGCTIGHTCGVKVQRVQSLTLIVPPLAVARELDSQGAAGD